MPMTSFRLQAEPCSSSEVTRARPGPWTLAPQSLQLLMLGIITAPQKRAGMSCRSRNSCWDDARQVNEVWSQEDLSLHTVGEGQHWRCTMWGFFPSLEVRGLNLWVFVKNWSYTWFPPVWDFWKDLRLVAVSSVPPLSRACVCPFAPSKQTPLSSLWGQSPDKSQ